MLTAGEMIKDVKNLIEITCVKTPRSTGLTFRAYLKRRMFDLQATL